MTRREELEDIIEDLRSKLARAEGEMTLLTEREDDFFQCPFPGQLYYFVGVHVNGNLEVRSEVNKKDRYSRNVLYSGRGFRTEQEAKDEIRRMTIRSKLEKVARCRNENKKLRMRAEQTLYYIYYNPCTRQLEQDDIHMLNMPAGVIVCEDESFLDDALKVIPREDLEWFCQDEK